MDNPAAVSDLTGRGLSVGGGDGQTTEAVAQTRLNEAWRALLLEPGMSTLPNRVGTLDGQIDPDAVADVVAAAALRVLRNPSGAEPRSGGVDDWQESEKLADATQDVYFTAAELRRLQATDSAAAAGGWSGSLKYGG